MTEGQQANRNQSSRKAVRWRGPVIGINEQGYQTPVFYDPHTSIAAGGQVGASSSNGILITGSPGSGKSFLGMTLATESTIEGKKTIFLDPKNDSLGMINLRDWMDNKITVWDINDKELAGSMDPFIFNKTIEQKISKAYALINILLGPFNEKQDTLLYPIIQDIANEPKASMNLLKMKLLRHSDYSINRLGTHLEAIQGSGNISDLIFGTVSKDTEIHQMEFNDGLTIISTFGLELPKSADPSTYQPKDKLSLGIMYLICDFILAVMKDDKHKTEPKTVFIDEAWAVTASAQGYRTVCELLRLGRAFNLAVVLMTQNTSDLERDDGKQELMNSVVTRFAFKCNEDKEAAILCDSMGIGEDYIPYFTRLRQGECIMRDYKKRISQISIINQFPEWAHAFETNPWKKAQQVQAAKKAQS